jgi:hypothetical protein
MKKRFTEAQIVGVSCGRPMRMERDLCERQALTVIGMSASSLRYASAPARNGDFRRSSLASRADGARDRSWCVERDREISQDRDGVSGGLNQPATEPAVS